MKRVLAILLAALMTVAVFVIPAGAIKSVYDAKDYVTSYVLTKVTNQSSGKTEAKLNYDKNGNLTREEYYWWFNLNGKTWVIDESQKCNYKYDDKNRLIQAVSDGSFGRYTENGIYNSQNCLDKTTVKLTYSKATQTTKYTYDNKGRVIKEKTGENAKKYTYSNDKLKTMSDGYYTLSYKYDETGKLYEYSTKTNNEKTVFNYQYFSNGNIKSVKKKTIDQGSVNPQEEVTNTSYKYDNNNNIKQIGEDLKYKYNSHNDVVLANGEKYSYKYDGSGNIIEFNGMYGAAYTIANKKITKKLIRIPLYFSGSIYDKTELYLDNYSYTYNGKKKTPKITIKAGSSPFEINTLQPYVVTGNNVEPGKGWIQILPSPDTYFEEPVTILFNIKPTAPKNPKASKIAKTSATLTWKKVTGADKYLVYQYNASTGKYSKIKSFKTNSATITGLKSGKTYKFCVKAVASGVYSAKSALVKVKTK